MRDVEHEVDQKRAEMAKQFAEEGRLDDFPAAWRKAEPQIRNEVGAANMEEGRTSAARAAAEKEAAEREAELSQPRDQMTTQQKAEFVAKHGQDAFMALPATGPSPQASQEDDRPRRSAMTVDQKAAYVSKHGQDAYMALPV